MISRNKNRRKRIALTLAGLVLFLCAGGALLSYLTNRTLPVEALDDAQLSPVDKARLAEITHLRRELGDSLWPGYGAAEIPLVNYNGAYAFVVGVGVEEPPAGWLKVPQMEPQGNPWEPVPGEVFEGRPYYRSPLPDSGQTPQAFTVVIGDRWAASLHTRPAMQVIMTRDIQSMVPDGLGQVLPIKLVTDLFLRNSDTYVGAVLHESFHAYQGEQSFERLAASERAEATVSDQYPREEASFREAWQAELDLLKAAVESDDPAATAELVRQFLAQREARRSAAALSPALIDYERQREWSEGLAFYTELQMLRLAYESEGYEPLAAIAGDPEFKGYQTFEQRWQQEVDQIARMAGNDGDGRFYYSGMAQGVLLDRLDPNWKETIFEEGVFLESLLTAAIAD